MIIQVHPFNELNEFTNFPGRIYSQPESSTVTIQHQIFSIDPKLIMHNSFADNIDPKFYARIKDDKLIIREPFPDGCRLFIET